MIYSIKTIVGREDVVLDVIATKIQSEKLNVAALVHPEEIKGYIFIEGELEDVLKALSGVPHVRGVIKKPIKLEELERFLKPKVIEIELNTGDTVEIIGGPFKGEKGKITRYDKIKREVTLELLEVSVPIPVTVSAEFVKLIEKKK
ncbi:MAG: transcription elongation factor Spt5 [Candidatus Aenigmarchaeota archaeon]|nr:transcription elongation factor Spt5 [Candidatus Aenigmarchaeota archaeon]